MPKRSLDKLTILGFKSIRELRDFPLTQRNILIGANGAGKSNVVDFFRMLRALALDGLRAFVTASGGGDGFFFEGPKVTPMIEAQVSFGEHGFGFGLKPTASSELMIDHLAILSLNDANKTLLLPGGTYEAYVSDWKQDTATRVGDRAHHVYAAISSWIVYHFHDTSMTSKMRRDADSSDHRELAADGGNLAPFLAHLHQQHPTIYQRIRETIQIVAPYFDDFLLEPRMLGPREVLRLEWRQRASSFPFQPWQLSDGTLRFIALATALLQPDPPATIVIDEPELGLHPVALRVLAALIHEVSANTQIVVSTQSPQLVDHFEPEDLVVVLRRDGATELERMNAANLERWLEDYTLGDLIEKNVIETNP
ncbi:MAG: AAA family ATPase [Nannocystis sp.]|uniref:AAA family ATPase n=1 Tax=Nannocystis sp. TaxID=1962667 RepID=UPI00242692A9|nr:AAA family ATPase [Nannocystis sp.]MBK9753526.1 AAA family ATPase [Nannocystis sp.]